MALVESLENAKNEYNAFVALLNTQRIAFKYFAMHQAFLPGDIVRAHIFPKVFDEDFMFCKFLEEFTLSESKQSQTYNTRKFYALKEEITRHIYEEISPSLVVKFELFGSLNTLPMPFDSNSTNLHKLMKTFIYQYMKSKDFKLRVHPHNYPHARALDYIEIRNMFMNQYTILKEIVDRLTLSLTQLNHSLENLNHYESSFIIIKDNSSYRPYHYLRFVKHCPKTIKVQPNLDMHVNSKMLQLTCLNRDYTRIIKKVNILKVIDPKDIPQDQIKDGVVSIKFLDTM